MTVDRNYDDGGGGGDIIMPSSSSTMHNNSMTPIDFSQYPPNPIVWAYIVVDTVCDPFGCKDWRQWLPERFTQPDGGWFSDDNRLQHSLLPNFPPMTPYTEYIQQPQQQMLDSSFDNNNTIYTNIVLTPPPYSIQSIYTYAFDTSSTSLAVLTTNTSLLTLAALVLCFRRLKAWSIPIFSSLGRTAARRTHGPDWELSNEVRIAKFGEYVFRLVFHGAISLAGIYLFWNEPWWAWLISPSSSSSSDMNAAGMGTKSLFLDYPFQPVGPRMIWYYLIQAAYNIEAMLCLLELSFDVTIRSVIDPNTRNKQWPIRIRWSQTVRGDFREMFVHHIITNMLVIGSSYFRFTRVGSMVFLVHDISDVPVDLSKLANFLKWKAATALCFFTLVIVWLLTRLLVLPLVIYRSVLFEAWLVCANGYIHPLYYVMYQPVFVVLIGLLIFLHFVWFTMFIRMGYVLIRKGEAHDYSEHKKGEKSSSSTTSNKKGGTNGPPSDNHSSSNGLLVSSGPDGTKKDN